MNYIWIVSLFALKVTCSDGQQINSTYIDGRNDKDDIWIWGYSDTKVDNRNTGVSTPYIVPLPGTTSEANDTDPCDTFIRTKPQFTGRISEIKCQEHIWQLTYNAERIARETRCKISRSEQEDPSGIDTMQNVPQVVGGHAVFPGEYPHMGALGWKSVQNDWQFLCGSTLISPDFVLTAAHCSRASSADTSLADTVPKIVRFMAQNLPGPVAKDINILQIIVHPDYKSPKQYYDIALIKLEKVILFNQLAQPACLWTKPELNELRNVTVTGWGVLKQNSLIRSQELQAGEIDVIDENICNQSLSKFCNRNWCGLSEQQFCAGKMAGGVDACQGDSGGPLQVKIALPDGVAKNLYYVFGVTSFGIGCAQPGLPGIYSKVSSFLDWIEPIVWPAL